jgi:hypothetical protein
VREPLHRIVTRSWISDTADEIEHPPVPLGLNEMAVPRVTLILSIITLLMIIVSSTWVGISAKYFIEDLDPFQSNNSQVLESDGRWLWEVDLLFDTCTSREDNWEWPNKLADQDDLFLYPGELRCDWEHQGENDRASVVIYNRGDVTIDLVITIDVENIIFASNSESSIMASEIESDNPRILEIVLSEGITEEDFSITAKHISALNSEVRLDVHAFAGTEQRDIHINDNDAIEVHYTVWDADSGEELDSGDLPVTAGDDPNYIKGFGWSAIGLDIDNDRGLIPNLDTGTSHITLLPPCIAYGNSEGHELQNSWLRFEIKVDRAPIS